MMSFHVRMCIVILVSCLMISVSGSRNTLTTRYNKAFGEVEAIHEKIRVRDQIAYNQLQVELDSISSDWDELNDDYEETSEAIIRNIDDFLTAYVPNYKAAEDGSVGQRYLAAIKVLIQLQTKADIMTHSSSHPSNLPTAIESLETNLDYIMLSTFCTSKKLELENLWSDLDSNFEAKGQELVNALKGLTLRYLYVANDGFYDSDSD